MYSRRRAVRRRRLLLVGILLIGLLLGALAWLQLRARRQGTGSPVDQLIMEIVAPSIHAANAVRNVVVSAPRYAVGNDGLTTQGGALLREAQTENQQLRALLGLRGMLPAGAIAAEVIGRSTVLWQGNLILDKGSTAGIVPHMVVLTPDGVIGQVAVVSPHTSGVLPLTDSASGIGAMIERSRVTGVLNGYADGTCRLNYLSGQADVKPGDRVITSGCSLYFPKGLLLGKVLSVAPNPTTSSRVAMVQPAANIDTAESVVVFHLPPQ